MFVKALVSTLLAMTLLGPGMMPSYEPDKFLLPEDAKVLVVVEGREDNTCRVIGYEKCTGENGKESWKAVFATEGNIGAGGMNLNRVRGDKSTPVGVWMMNTPFGQKPALEGFPSDYIQVSKHHVWTDDTNKLIVDETGKIAGERVGTDSYSGFYDYVIDAGFNKNAVTEKGSALFIHCQKGASAPSSGCVKIPTETMVELMKLYGKYGTGKCFIAQGKLGEVDKLYNAYGTNNGLEAKY